MIVCNICSTSYANINDYNKHQKILSNIPNVTILCKYRGCNKYFDKYVNFVKHIYRMHNTSKDTTGAQCYVCKKVNCNFKCGKVNIFRKHLY